VIALPVLAAVAVIALRTLAAHLTTKET